MVFIPKVQRKYRQHKKHPAAGKKLRKIPDISYHPARIPAFPPAAAAVTASPYVVFGLCSIAYILSRQLFLINGSSSN